MVSYFRTASGVNVPLRSRGIFSSAGLIANAWYPKTATATMNLTSTELANPSYNLAYICTWTGTNWKCGCRDSACTKSYWQIQSFKR
jgi:hypothetical protein